MRLFAAHGLEVFDVEELPTHGGSLRVYAAAARRRRTPIEPRGRARCSARERGGGLRPARGLRRLRAAGRARRSGELLELLIGLPARRQAGRRLRRPGKGNTLLNYCGIRTDLLDYTVDRNPYKHGKFLPGTHIPIHPPERIAETRPDYDPDPALEPEARRSPRSSRTSREWGAQLIVPIPQPESWSGREARP